jgi:polysaccharide deacetylase 2 family uncharacterized protein YibQ
MKALAVAAGIVFWTLVLGTAWLAFFPGGGEEESIAILQVEPPPGGVPQEESAAEESQDAGTTPAGPSESGMDLPPGFAVTGPGDHPQEPTLPPPPSGETQNFEPVTPGQLGAPAPSESPPPDDAAPPADDRQGAAPATEQTASASEPELETEKVALAPPAEAAAQPAAQPATAAATPDVSEETGSIQLAAVPVAELVEESQYGPLPKIAIDGRRPADVYARPSRYAAKAGAGEPARVAVLVNGLGLPDGPNPDVLAGLPAPVSVAYGAYGRSLQDLVSQARSDGHEVLLQIPLEPQNYPDEDPGPHTLLTTLPPAENLKRLQWLMSRYTGYVGVTNHMGAKFEATQDSLLPVLEEVKRRGLIYIDDGTVQSSAAGQIATTLGLDYSVAHVRLDAGELSKDLAELEAAARQRGAAIGVAKAEAGTVKRLTEWAGGLESKGIVLVPVSAAVRTLRQS